jgi:hypothetical protein
MKQINKSMLQRADPRLTARELELLDVVNDLHEEVVLLRREVMGIDT